MIKILWGLHEAHPSGAVKCFLDYQKILDPNKYQVEVIIPSNGPIEKILDHNQIKYHLIPFYNWTKKVDAPFSFSLKRFLRNVVAIFQLVILIGKKDFHICCTNTATFSVLAVAACIRRRKHIWFNYEFGREDHGFTFQVPERMGYLMMGRLSKNIVVNSSAVKNKIDKFIKPSKIKLIRFPINLLEYPNEKHLNNKAAKTFIILGQIAPSKGHLEVIEALKLLNAKDIKLFIIGNCIDDSYLQEMRNRISSSELENIVEHKGYMSNPYPFLSECHYLIMSSRSEAYSRVVLEAMALGVPVIGKNTGGTGDQVIENYNGFLYGSVEELAAKIELAKNLKTEDYLVLSDQSVKSCRFHTNPRRITEQLEAIMNR